MNPYSQDQYGQYPVASPVYSDDAAFDTADFETYDSYGTYPMQRITSGLSHSSYDSALPSEYLTPSTGDSNYEFDNYQAPYSNNYSTQSPYSTPATSYSYTTTSSQAGVPRNTGGYQSQAVAQISTTKPNSVQADKNAEWRCLAKDCKQKPFKRHADLKRHLKHVHRSSSEEHFCDWSRCSRSKGSSSTGNDERATRNPFSRWDHLKAHMRDYHKEPIPKRGGKDHAKFFEGRVFQTSWWRCSKCLSRNRVDGGYKCNNCSQNLELAVIEERQRRFPTERPGDLRRRR